jgi:ATP-dependent exoDNAse (exonuclease V) beta subunit
VNTNANFILQEASAGSGKTFSLVKRYLSILLTSENPDKFKQLLAITFTNKASLEMKNRVMEWLVDFSGSHFSTNKVLEIIANETQLSPEIIHQRAKNILTKIIHQYSQFSISTIDKFNLRLMKSFAHDLGLSMNFDVEMDQKKLLIESIQLLFDKIGQDEKLTQVLIEVAINNLEEGNRWDISNNLLQFSRKILSGKFEKEIEIIQKTHLDEYQLYRKTLNKSIIDTKKELVEIGTQAVQLIEENGISVNEFYQGKNGIGGYFESLTLGKLTKQNSYHQLFLSNEKLVAAKVKPETKATIQNMQPQLAEMATIANEKRLQMLYNQRIVKNLVEQSLVSEINKILQEIKNNKNVLLISEFNQKIAKYLKDQPAPFIYERLGEYYQHFFVDEFQDTSTLQWQNIFPLLENAKASVGTILLVGDAKQSIYRFRGANSDLMIDLQQDKESFGLSIETLDTNYRSFSEIIQFNNRLYEFISHQIQNEKHQAIYQKAHQNENDKKGGFVQLDFLNYNELGADYEELLNEKIVNYIKKCKEKNYEYKDIAILTRGNKQGAKIAEFLAQSNIPVISDEALFLDSSTEIKCIIHYLKWIENELDKKSLSQFCLCLKQLNKISDEIDISAFIFDLIRVENAFEVHTILANEHKIDLRNAENETDDLYTRIEKIIAKLQFDSSKNGFIQSFLDYVFSYTQAKESTLANFLVLLEDTNPSISMPEELNAVKILTIHKSKGLEFPVVILPFFEKTDKREDMWVPTKNKKIPTSFIKTWAGIEQENLDLVPMIQKEEDQMILDKINVLYVATTRAKENLCLIIPTKNEREKIDEISLVSNFSKTHYPQQESVSIGNFQALEKHKPKNNSIEQNIPYVFNHWKDKIEIAHRYSSIYNANEKKNYGNLIHLLLGEIYTAFDIEPIVEKHFVQGLYESHEKETIKNLLQKMVLHNQLAAYFSIENQTIYNERSFINQEGEIVRPDKVILSHNLCVIIDYKTGERNEKHLFQMNKYESLFRDNYLIVKKLLVYVGQENIEVVEV